MTEPILPTRNDAWGFFGTASRFEPGPAVDPGEAWALAFDAVRRATGAGGEAVREFLDSRHGRHFADDVSNGLARGRALGQAVAAATDRWTGWRIGRRTSRETGIPAGLPYLTGWVTHYEILAEADAAG